MLSSNAIISIGSQRCALYISAFAQCHTCTLEHTQQASDAESYQLSMIKFENNQLKKQLSELSQAATAESSREAGHGSRNFSSSWVSIPDYIQVAEGVLFHVVSGSSIVVLLAMALSMANWFEGGAMSAPLLLSTPVTDLLLESLGVSGWLTQAAVSPLQKEVISAAIISCLPVYFAMRRPLADVAAAAAHAFGSAGCFLYWQRYLVASQPSLPSLYMLAVLAAVLVHGLQTAAFDQRLQGRLHSVLAVVSWLAVSAVVTAATASGLYTLTLLASAGSCSLWEWQPGNEWLAVLSPAVDVQPWRTQWQPAAACAQPLEGEGPERRLAEMEPMLWANVYVSVFSLLLLASRAFLHGLSSIAAARLPARRRARRAVATLSTCGCILGPSRCLKLYSATLVSLPGRFIVRWGMAIAAIAGEVAVCAAVGVGSHQGNAQAVAISAIQCPQVWTLGLMLAAVVSLCCQSM